MKQDNKRIIEAVELDVFRRSLRISRLERRRNKEARQIMGIEPVITETENNQLI